MRARTLAALAALALAAPAALAHSSAGATRRPALGGGVHPAAAAARAPPAPHGGARALGGARRAAARLPRAASSAMSLRGGALLAAAASGAGPSWTSLLPPLATIVISLAAKQVIVALVGGLWVGASLAHGSAFAGLLRAVDSYALDALADREHAGILIFTLLLGGAIGVVQRTGGSLGLARAFGPLARTRRSTGGTALGLGSLVFFDDYSSVLIVGNSLREPARRVGLSREKFALIVHTLATCVASISPISSWTGLQLGYVAGACEAAGVDLDGFGMLLATLPYRQLPLLMLALVSTTVLLNRDLGSVAAAEAASRPERAEAGAEDETAGTGSGAELPPALGPLDPRPDTPLRPINALLPFATIIAVAFGGMLIDGGAKLAAAGAVGPHSALAMLAACDSVRALVWASLAGTLVAAGLGLGQGIVDVQEAMAAWVEGTKEVLEPCIILVLAWALGAVIADVRAADFLAQALQGGALPRPALPALLSLLCYAMSYATGSAAGTMGVVFPLAAPLAASLAGGSLPFIKQCFGAILGGSLFGNICSPIADTSIMTALATKVSVPAHVSTITPYVALAGGATLACQLLLGAGVGAPVPVLLGGAAALGALVRFAGKPAPKE